jgi:TonB-dependent receptor
MRIVRPLGFVAAAILSSVVVSSPLYSQQSSTGRIAGRVVDVANGQPVAGAQVTVEGTGIAVLTDWAGRFLLPYVPAGRWTVSVRAIGYTHKSVTGVEVAVQAATPLDVSLGAAAIEMAGVEVTAEMERGSVAKALNEQRNSDHIVSSITVEQIRKSPDSDAGQAVQRVSGVSVQDGKYVLVRGLGERYTTTALNGARIPSPEPERKMVPLDLFPSGLLQSIVTSKTFTPEQPGDFTGAQVDLRTRDFPLSRMFTFSFSSSYNTAFTGQSMLRAPTFGPEWLGFAGSERAIPEMARDAGNLSGLSDAEMRMLAGSFNNAWSAHQADAGPNASFAVSVGGEDRIAGLPTGYVGSLTYSYGQEARLEEQRAVAIYGGVPDSALSQDERTGQTGTQTVLWGGLLNLSMRPSRTSQLSFNNTYTRGGDNQATHLVGFDEEFGQIFDITQLTFTERTVRSNQVAGEHLLADRHSFSWGLTSSGVRRYEPDRSGLVYETTVDPGSGEPAPSAWWGQARSAFRTFSDLDESSLEARSAFTGRFGAAERSWIVKVGGLARNLERDADTRLYELRNQALSDAERARTAEAIFDGTAASEGKLFVLADAYAGRYTARDRLFAGFLQAEIPLGGAFRLLAGARIEDWNLEMPVQTLVGLPIAITRHNTDILPALALTMRMGEKHVLRLSASQTVSRPEYREMAPITYRDILGGVDMAGNAELERALIRNADLRWEWYPNTGEILSLGLFGKAFSDPIERIFVGTTGANTVTFQNARGATNYGVEIELRKQLITLGQALAPFSVFGNATLMESRIELDETGSVLTNADRPMAGQSGIVLNGGLSYSSSDGRWNATLLYNFTGRRIAEAGTGGIPDAYEGARETLDLSVQLPVLPGASLKMDGRNLFDTPIEVTQGSVTRARWTTGRIFTVGLSWQP